MSEDILSGDNWQQAAIAAIEDLPGDIKVPDVLEVPLISSHGNVMEIIELFGGVDRLREAVNTLQSLP